ncbi:MAG: hypothetical protein KDE19_19475 [Caldilineaceae bacterium]|nr:hypothetical protein [Caldilineaceae bacterium]
MKIDLDERIETHIQRLAADTPYPPTPDLVAAVAERIRRTNQPALRRSLQPLWVTLLALIIILVGLLSVAPVRAALLDWLQIGAVRIWQTTPPLSPTASPVQVAPSAAPTLRPTATFPLSDLDFTGETTLAAAQAAVDFPILLPTIPSDLGPPDHVYLQRMEGDLVILVWMQPNRPTQVRMSLHLLGPGAFVWKMQPPALAETTVHGERAVWIEGPYYIQAEGSWANRRLVDGPVLVWTAGAMTYRLEGALALEEALRVAESLVTVQSSDKNGQ